MPQTEDTVASWLDADQDEGHPHVEIDDNAGVPLLPEDAALQLERKEAWWLYSTWCERHGLTPLGKNTFYDRLRRDPRVGVEQALRYDHRVFPNLWKKPA